MNLLSVNLFNVAIAKTNFYQGHPKLLKAKAVLKYFQNLQQLFTLNLVSLLYFRSPNLS